MQDKKFLDDLRLKNIKELQSELVQGRKEVFEAKMQSAQGKLKNVKKIGQLKRQAAQILTVIKGKEQDE